MCRDTMMSKKNSCLQCVPILCSETDNKQINNVMTGRNRCNGCNGAQSQAKEIVDGSYFK